MQRLGGKVALVTGAGRGLGWGIARALGRQGAKVCITDINGSELERARADMVADGSEVMARVLDVADRDAFEELVAAWRRRGGSWTFSCTALSLCHWCGLTTWRRSCGSGRST